MENSFTKFVELVKAGKIDPDKKIKKPCITKQKFIDEINKYQKGNERY